MTLALVVVALLALLAVRASWRGLVAFVRFHGPGPLAWRWLTGHPLGGGEPLTDRGWLRPGTKALTRTGHAPRSHYRPRLHHAGIRTGGTLAVILAAVGWAADPRLALVVAGCSALALAAACAVAGQRAWRARRHRRDWVTPLHRVLAPVVGHPLSARPDSWLEIAPDRSSARLALPPGFPADDGDKPRVVRIAAAKLGLEAPEASWRLQGSAPCVVLTRSEPPPARVALDDVMDAVEAAGRHELVVGLGKRGKLVKASLTKDSAHILLSMGSGAGKSTAAAFLIMQWLHSGGCALILDAKWLSHSWLIGMPNVRYARTIPELHEAMCWIRWELERRKEVALASVDTRGIVHANVGARLLVVAEEVNLTMDDLKAHWAEIRDPKRDPKRSPALTGLASASYAGRQFGIHVMTIGQMVTAASTGAADSSVRESMGIRLLSRYTDRSWKMLAGDRPMPPAPSEPGRVQLVSGQLVREVQIPFVDLEGDPDPAREYAMSGIVTPFPAVVTGSQEIGAPAYLAPEQAFPPVTALPVTRGVTLREAVDAGIIGPSLTAVRQARQRSRASGLWPEPVGHRALAELYDPAALAAWADGKVPR